MGFYKYEEGKAKRGGQKTAKETRRKQLIKHGYTLSHREEIICLNKKRLMRKEKEQNEEGYKIRCDLYKINTQCQYCMMEVKHGKTAR